MLATLHAINMTIEMMKPPLKETESQKERITPHYNSISNCTLIFFTKLTRLKNLQS